MTSPFRVPHTIGKLPLLPLAGIAFCIFMLSQLELSILALGTLLTAFGWVLSFVALK